MKLVNTTFSVFQVNKNKENLQLAMKFLSKPQIFRKKKKNFADETKFSNISQGFIFADDDFSNISRGLIFADDTQIREIREI